MKIALVSTYVNIDVLGPRYISSYLKRGGHDVRLIFLASTKGRRDRPEYAPALLTDLTGLLADVDLVGVSLMTNDYFRAVSVSQAIRRANIKAPIVWGGVHPTVEPQSCADHADIVCIGEGEQAMLELADRLDAGRDPTGVPGMAVVQNGRLHDTTVWPLSDNLDTYPFPDIDLHQEHYAVRDGHLVPADRKLMRDSLKRYRLLSTRGCPFHCAFCNNATIQQLYRGHGPWVRRRSVENVVAELEAARARFDSIRTVKVVDDLFFIRTDEQIEQFARVYRQRVALPFQVDAHPATVTRRKMDALVDAGLFRVNMGIQSGSDRTNFQIFTRPTSQKQIAAAIDILADYPQLQTVYHYIVHNPFEPDEQMLETVYFAAQHHRGQFHVDIFPLAFFPGSPLYHRARAEGIIRGTQEQLFGRFWRSARTWALLGDYLVVLLAMVLKLKYWGLSARSATRFVTVAASRPVRAVFDRPWLPALAMIGWVAVRFARNLIYQPFIRPFTRTRRSGRRGWAPQPLGSPHAGCPPADPINPSPSQPEVG